MYILLILFLISALLFMLFKHKNKKVNLFESMHLQWFGDVSGSIRKVVLDGISFDAIMDTNISETGSAYENDRIATSGKSFKKMTKRVEKAESVVLKANADEKELLKGLAERLDDFPMSYTTADGSVFRTKGSIEFEGRETMENRATIQMHPADTWEIFSA